MGSSVVGSISLDIETGNTNHQPSPEFKVSIFRVPKSLCKGNEAAYLPEMVRLGIFSRCASTPNAQDDHFQETDTEKQLLLQKYLFLDTPEFQQTAIQSIQCYQVKGLDLNKRQIPLEMLEDALYILKYLRSLSSKHRGSRKPGVIILTEIMKDILKLQNQIPLPLLQDVYKHKYHNYPISFDECLKQNLSEISPFHSPGDVELPDSVGFRKSQHLLQCCHEMVLGVGTPRSNEICLQNLLKGCQEKVLGKCFDNETPSTGASSRSNEIYLKNAIELSKAGIRFKPLQGRSGIRHIKFDEKECTLYLPRMSMGLVYSEVIWKNLIAFELCSNNIEEKADDIEEKPDDIEEKPVVSFIHFMDDLINDGDDTNLFIKNDIFCNVRNDRKVAEFWNSLCHSTRRPQFGPIDDAAGKMNKVYESRTARRKWSEFVESYRPRPWTLISAIATAFVVLLTVVQVTCTFYTCNTIFVKETIHSP